MNDEKEKPDKPGEQVAQGETPPALCACVTDPFASLPPELQPRPVNRRGDLRKVTCPGCGLVYLTNRKTDLCMECEKKGVRLPKPATPEG